MKRPLRTISALTLSLVLSACASYSGINLSGEKIAAEQLGAKPATDLSKAEWPQQDWWLALNDATLSRLIEQALAGSPTLKEADARLVKARSAAGVADSFRYPQINGSVASTRERFSENGMIPPPFGGTTQSVNDAMLSGSWEIDFFGRNREGVQAALGELRATEAEHQAARILLSTDVASTYYNLARLLAQRDIVAQQNRQRATLLQLEDSRVKAGIDAPGDLEPLKGGVEENRRDSAAVDEQIALTRHALAALLGQGPEAANDVHATLPADEKLALPEQLPAELLGHRADIVAARWRVESGLHGMEAGKAMFYPNINLRGFAGLSAIGLDNWLESGSRQIGLGIAISLPIFDAGRLRNQYRGVAAQTDGAIATYNKTLVNAFRDVADQVSSLQSIEQQVQRQQDAVASAQQSHTLAQQRYQSGITGALPVLNAEANLLAQRRQLTDLQARRADGRVKLVHALGGGFAEQEKGGTHELTTTEQQGNTQPGNTESGVHHG